MVVRHVGVEETAEPEHDGAGAGADADAGAGADAGGGGGRADFTSPNEQVDDELDMEGGTTAHHNHSIRKQPTINDVYSLWLICGTENDDDDAIDDPCDVGWCLVTKHGIPPTD